MTRSSGPVRLDHLTHFRRAAKSPFIPPGRLHMKAKTLAGMGKVMARVKTNWMVKMDEMTPQSNVMAG